MSRQSVGLRPPSDAAVAVVPDTRRLRPLHRCCSRAHDQPWWFADRRAVEDPGRFDLVHPNGTSYWALSPAAAILEATADPDAVDLPVVTPTALVNLRVWRAEHVPAARSRLADVTAATAPGLTAELSTVVPYDLPWQWADALHADGRSGILYTARFANDEAVALFGPAGAPDGGGPEAVASPALDHLEDLPAAFRDQVSDVGELDQLPRAPAP